MFNVFLILFAFVIQQAAYLLRDLTLIAKGAHGFVYLVPVLSLSVMLVFWLYGRVFCLILRRKFERWPYHRDKYYILSRKFGFSYKVMLLASYIAILVVFNNQDILFLKHLLHHFTYGLEYLAFTYS